MGITEVYDVLGAETCLCAIPSFCNFLGGSMLGLALLLGSGESTARRFAGGTGGTAGVLGIGGGAST